LPGIIIRASSPKAISAPNASATSGSTTSVAATCPTLTIISVAATVSRIGHHGARARSPLRGNLDRRCRVVMVLHHGLGLSGGRGGRPDRRVPAPASHGGDERVDHDRVELGPGVLAQLLER